ncbi:hypothetical protein EI613_31655 (plasmid) [Azospirillum sp. 412522]|nr:hypothetical protein [Azospirillum sp. 412522]MBY6266421.1 hypothetical protein [Azospirillum sp. 412522]
MSTYALTTLIFIWLMANLPLVAIPEATYDDALFVRQAVNLLGGRWLGDYDNFTLAKGPFYPVWIAFSWLAGLPILVSQGIAYALACLVLVRGLRGWLPRSNAGEAAAFGLFLLLLFNPMTYSLGQMRVMREGIYVPLTVLLFGLGIWWFRWRNRGLPRRILLAGGMGVVLGLFWCTREEGLWVLPAFAAGFGLVLLMHLLTEGADGRLRFAVRLSRGTVGRIAGALIVEAGIAGLAAGAALLVIGGFGWMNQRHYGVSDVVEFKQREFVSAYGSLSRIRHRTPWTPYVVIPREVLERVYPVSSAAAELRPYFDSAAPDGMEQIGCATYNVTPCDGEIRAGWFMWALRDATAQAGHYRSATEAKDFYRRMTREIDMACNDGRLDCLPSRVTMVPPFRAEYIWSTLQAAGRMIGFLATMESAGVPRSAMSCMVDDCGQNPTRSVFLDMVRSPLFTHAPWLRTSTEFQRRSQESGSLPFQRRTTAVATLLDTVAVAYRTVLPILLGAGLIGVAVAVAIAIRLRRIDPLLLVAGFAALLVLSRAALLSVLEATAIPSMNSLYLSPAYPMLILFGVTGVAGAVRMLARREDTGSVRPPVAELVRE